ncbi:MAG: T9SS type A sorting domain-containing protein [Crocinitomicaceae bacterium]|nr:T9SS type A sorting domain-containing protein [Crocinitomicaceae bacterium]
MNCKSVLSFSLLTFFVTLTSTAQTGAGGVGTTGTNPMWYDANELNLVNGNKVSNWQDMSGNGNDLSQTNATKQPIYTDGALNGLPVVTFDGADDFLTRGATSGLGGGEITVFIVFQRSSATAQCLINAGYSAELDKWMIYDPGNDRLVCKHKSPTNKYAMWIGGTGTPTFTSTHYRGAGTQVYSQGNLMGTNSTPYTAQSGHNLIRVGTYNYNVTNYLLDGFIAEIVVFNTDLNILERRIVENYLGAKYGLSIPVDRYAYEATHNVGVIGIGDNGFDTHTDSKGAGVLQISNPTALTTGDHLFCGHTNDALSSFTTADIPASLSGSKRWTRTWRAGETNDVGTVNVTYHLTGGNNFAAGATYRLLVDTDGNFSDATIVSGTYDGGTQTVSFTYDFSDGDYFTLCGVEQTLDIHSITSGNWSNTATWDCTCIPTSNDDVFIDPGHTVTVDVNAECDSLYIDPTSTLAMNSTVNIDILGSFDNDGTANFTDGSVSLIGTQEQTVDAGANGITFNDLIINNTVPSDVNFVNGTFTLNGLMTPTSGNVIVSSPFIINSTSATTGGRVGMTGGGCSFTGEFTVRRFLEGGNSDWRNIASPVMGADFNDWDPDLSISCTDCPDGCAYGSNGCFVSIRRYKNNTTLDISSINDPITNATGYEVYCGDDLSTFTGTTLNTTGTLRTGTLDESVSGNWEIKGNPYACPIDFDDLTFSGVGQYYYVYDAAIGGYQWYDRASGSASTPELADGYVAMGQAIWMMGPGTISFTEGMKVENADATFKTQEKPDYSLYLTLKENSSLYSCIANIDASVSTLDGLDELDVMHLELPDQKAPSIAFKTSGELVRKSYLEQNRLDKAVPVYINILNEGYYTIEASNIANFNDYSYVYLYDSETGDMIDLKDENYVFYSEVGVHDSRLTLILSNSEVSDSEDTGYLNISDDNNGISFVQMDHVVDIRITDSGIENAEITLINALGQVERYFELTSLVEGSNLITIPADVKGVRILCVNINGQRITKKLVF